MYFYVTVPTEQNVYFTVISASLKIILNQRFITPTHLKTKIFQNHNFVRLFSISRLKTLLNGNK